MAFTQTNCSPFGSRWKSEKTCGKMKIRVAAIIKVRVVLMEVLWMLQYPDAQFLGPQFAKKMLSIFKASWSG